MTCALYRHYQADGALLYVGVTNSPERRAAQHQKSSVWFAAVKHTTIEWFNERSVALIAEKAAIAAERPVHNLHSAGKTNGAAAFIDAAGKDDLAESLGVTFAAVRNAHWRDRLPSSWAMIVAQACLDRGLYCPTHAFNWAGQTHRDDRCISDVLFSERAGG